MPSPTLGELHRRTVATAPTTAAESAPPPTLASLCGYVDPIPPSVGIAAEGLTLTPQLITSLKQSPGRNIQVGEIVHHDCRGKARSSLPPSSNRLKLIQWNIERGYQLPRIIELLRRQVADGADIIALQEVDIGCERSGWIDTGKRIAEALEMNYIFVCEFHELYSPLRPPSAQGGGVHGNAILSRYDFRSTWAIHHRETFAWNRLGHTKKEPRVGERFTLGAELVTPNGVVVVYSAHFEVFTGITGRLQSYREILNDSTQRIAKGGSPYQVILGDFNTLSHGIARCSSSYCNDSYRWRSLGYTESEWWIANIFHHETHNQAGFYDPFDAYQDATLSNYKGWFQGKLDWILLKNLTSVNTWLDNSDYKASDHKLLGCQVEFDQPTTTATTTTPTAPLTVASNISDSPSPVDAQFPRKSTAQLRQLMPLRRPSPGIVTSSATDVTIFGTQIAVFWLVLAIAIAWGIMQALGHETQSS